MPAVPSASDLALKTFRNEAAFVGKARVTQIQSAFENSIPFDTAFNRPAGGSDMDLYQAMSTIYYGLAAAKLAIEIYDTIAKRMARPPTRSEVEAEAAKQSATDERFQRVLAEAFGEVH